MLATTFEIAGRYPKAHLSLADIKDFGLRESGQIAAEGILENPHITLYSLDFGNRRAVFVETPPDVNLSQAPFYYLAQYENAVRVLTVSFATMIHLAQSVIVDDERLIFIHSVGRAGSTLASRIFADVEGVVNISEPDALTQLVIARYYQPDNKVNLMALLDATVRLLCKTPPQTAWVIKGRSFVIELGDWLRHLYPRTKNLFLYRDAESWLQSGLTAYNDGVERTDEERWAIEDRVRGFMTPFTPLIAQYDADQRLSFAGIYALMWLSVMERYMQLHGMGIDILAIRYASWRSAPRETVVAMLDYCACRPVDMTAVYERLTKDSQASISRLSQEETARRKKRGTRASDLDELNRHLQKHPSIRVADFEAPNTLKTPYSNSQ